MMVVEKDIRDNVLNALYKQMGMQKKAQGIVFSLRYRMWRAWYRFRRKQKKQNNKKHRLLTVLFYVRHGSVSRVLS